jgi:cytochrome c-type biogenesis protein CcmH/NrfG
MIQLSMALSRESLAFGLSGVFFGLLVGWIIGAQHADGTAPPAVTTTATASESSTPAPPPDPQRPAPEPLDASRVAALQQQAAAEPANDRVRTDLGNMYFDAQRYSDAAQWYEASLKINPRDVNVSTDLAVCYYQMNDVDRALAQLDHSLSIDPRHLKTLFNQGLIRAFGKQDLAGAAESWRKVVAIAPNSEEGRHAQQGLDGIEAAGHPQPGTGGNGTGS